MDPVEQLMSLNKLIRTIILISGFSELVVEFSATIIYFPVLSLWTSCILIVGVVSDLYEVNPLIIITAVACHAIISLAVTKGLLYGIKKKNPDFFVPWIFTKIVESVLMLFGYITCAIMNNGRNVGLIPVGIVLLLACCFITILVWKSSKEIQPTLNSQMVVSVECDRNIIPGTPKTPPFCDNFTNEKY